MDITFVRRTREAIDQRIPALELSVERQRKQIEDLQRRLEVLEAKRPKLSLPKVA